MKQIQQGGQHDHVPEPAKKEYRGPQRLGSTEIRWSRRTVNVLQHRTFLRGAAQNEHGIRHGLVHPAQQGDPLLDRPCFVVSLDTSPLLAPPAHAAEVARLNKNKVAADPSFAPQPCIELYPFSI